MVYTAPFNREIGRLPLERVRSVLVLIRRALDLLTNSLTENPLIVALYQRHGSLRVLNAGSGGAADMPWFYDTTREILVKNGIRNPQISITNIDNSLIASEATNGELRYISCKDLPNSRNLLENSDFDLDTCIQNYFERMENEEVQLETFGGKESKMVPTYRAKNPIEVHIGNIQNLKFEDNRFNLVFAHHILQYVPEPVKAAIELVRVCKNGGLLFPNFAIYQKSPTGRSLHKITGPPCYRGRVLGEGIGLYGLARTDDTSTKFSLERLGSKSRECPIPPAENLDSLFLHGINPGWNKSPMYSY